MCNERPQGCPTRLTPTERRKLVDLGIKAGKSNRAIAKEVNVDEKMIRLDRKFLATPEHERPVKKARPARVLDLAKLRRRRVKSMFEVLKGWIEEQGLILPDLEYVLHEAGRHLYQGRVLVSRFPESPHDPAELLPMTRPNYMVEDYMPVKLDYCAVWLACCLPHEETLRDELLRETSIWARSG